MTGYTVHTGSTEKFSEGWDRIFSGSRKNSQSKAAGGRSTGKKSAAKIKKPKKK